MKALVLAPFSGDALAALERLVPTTYESWQDSRRLHCPEELADRLVREQIGALFIEADFVLEEVFQGAPCLRFVGVCRSTLNHVDLEAATHHGVVVAYAPSRNATAVAELTIGLMIALARHIPHANQYVMAGRWQDPVEPYLTMRGFELRGKTLGIVGTGVIGGSVARLGEGLGMKVMGYDPFAGCSGTWNGAMQPVTREQLLRESDFVSVHVSGASNTECVLDVERLQMMKAGSYLINTAAHAAVDEAGLVALLGSGHIAGAALDVHVSHPIPPSSPLLRLDNVILTPHIGGATQETVERHSWMMVEALRRFLAGKPPEHLANPNVWECRG